MPRRMITLLALSSLFVAPAVAQDGNSRLQVTMDRPVGLMVDGRMQEIEDNSMTYIVENLQPGRHEVSLRAMFGRELANVFVDVPDYSEVRCRYRRKAFECYDTVALAPVVETIITEPVLAIAEPSTQTEVIETTTVTTGGMPGIGGEVTIAGPDGETVSVGVHLGGLGGPAMGATITETTTVTTTTPEPGFVEVVPAVAVPSKVTLVLRSSDGEWADVVVDGKVVAEFRNDDEIKVNVAPGSHTVEVRKFMEDKGYTRAKIDTGYSDTVIVGITEGQPIECYNHDGCYTH